MDITLSIEGLIMQWIVIVAGISFFIYVIGTVCKCLKNK